MGTPSLQVLPQDVRREGERLFDLSMWCLGRDVLHPDNLLLRRGLTRARLPAGQQGTSAYGSSLEGGEALTLWGFGVVCRSAAGCVYVPRSGFTPALVEAERVERPLFSVADLGVPRLPGTREECRAARAAVRGLARWLAAYEEWVEQLMGPTWRQECAAAPRRPLTLPTEGLAEAWRRFAARVEALEPPFVVT